MSIKIIFLLTLLAYSMIVSQSFMYIIALKKVQLNLEVHTYSMFRKLIDTVMRVNFKYVIYAALFTNFTLVVLTISIPASLVFITALIAFMALITDTLLTVKGSLPINNIINNWGSENYPSNWAEYRTKWFSIFQYRQMANIVGFVSLLIGAVFGTK